MKTIRIEVDRNHVFAKRNQLNDMYDFFYDEFTPDNAKDFFETYLGVDPSGLISAEIATPWDDMFEVEQRGSRRLVRFTFRHF